MTNSLVPKNAVILGTLKLEFGDLAPERFLIKENVDVQCLMLVYRALGLWVVVK